MSALARLYPMSFAAVQKHVAVLEKAGLVVKEKTGRRKLVTTNIDAVRTAQRLLEVIEDIWKERLERFEDVLVQSKKENDK